MFSPLPPPSNICLYPPNFKFLEKLCQELERSVLMQLISCMIYFVATLFWDCIQNFALRNVVVVVSHVASCVHTINVVTLHLGAQLIFTSWACDVKLLPV